MRTVFMMRGLPASGKSRKAAEMVKSEPKRFVRINRDDLRAMSAGFGNDPHGAAKKEDLIRSFKEDLMKRALSSGFDVILDDTHLVPVTVKKLHQALAAIGDVTVVEMGFDVPVEECIRRDSNRTGFAHVGEKVIRGMAAGAKLDKGRMLAALKETYYPPRGGTMAGKQYDRDASLPPAIMCDLDGTLAIMGDRSPYDASDCDVKDHPNWPVIKCVLAMHAMGHQIIFMSGRDSKYRPETIRFIEKYCLVRTFDNSVEVDKNGVGPGGWVPVSQKSIPYQLHMRAENDMRKDSIIKEELFVEHVYGKFNVEFVVDDRNQVVDVWRAMGLTCFQCAEGNF